MIYCDECGDYASYCLDDHDLCEKCAKEYISELWDDLSLREQSELLDIIYCSYD